MISFEYKNEERASLAFRKQKANLEKKYCNIKKRAKTNFLFSNSPLFLEQKGEALH